MDFFMPKYMWVGVVVFSSRNSDFAVKLVIRELPPSRAGAQFIRVEAISKVLEILYDFKDHAHCHVG
jgi:hypothetical protein